MQHSLLIYHVDIVAKWKHWMSICQHLIRGYIQMLCFLH